MNPLQARSLQMRLAVRLGALFMGASVVLMSAFIYLSYTLVESLSRQDLLDLSEELADGIKRDDIDIDVDELIADSLLNQFTRYAVFNENRQLLVSNDQAFVDAVLETQPDFEGTSLFSIDLMQPDSRPYQGLIATQSSDRGPVIVVVAEPQNNERERLAVIARDVMIQAAWLVPFLIALTVLVGVMAIRSGLEPVRRTAKEAELITPATLSARLTTKDLPGELMPVVGAVNYALDRLEAGFELQRRFTANAAHELRTPLAIISSAIDGMGNDEATSAIRKDIARMNRLVEQLLHVARLDSKDIDMHSAVDLVQIARQVLEQLAPVAIVKGHSIGLVDGPDAVRVQGNAHAIEDAVRNLVENAIVHGTPANIIDLQVRDCGAISVCDQGPGVSETDKSRVFDRFWRGKQAVGHGAGLGLSIVQSIIKQHGGTVRIESNTQGGSCFVLQFRLSAAV